MNDGKLNETFGAIQNKLNKTIAGISKKEGYLLNCRKLIINLSQLTPVFMKLFKVLFTAVSVYFLFILLGTSFSGCTKTKTVYDTTVVTIRDTITVQDTVTIIDTLCKISDSMIAYYNFNGGNLNDSSGHNNNIYFSDATLATDRFGNPGNAYSFDGSTSYMAVKNSASLNPNNITMFAIVKLSAFNHAECNSSQIFEKGFPDDVNGWYGLRVGVAVNGSGGVCFPTVDTTKELFLGFYGDDVPQGTAAGAFGAGAGDSVFIQKDEWYTIAYTYDGATSNFYINGALVNSVPNANTVTFTPNSDDLTIGQDGFTAIPYYFNGVIDEIRIYNQAISAQQIGYLNILKTKYLKVGGKLIY